MTYVSTGPVGPAEPRRFATSEDLPWWESELKLASSHLSQTPCLCYLCAFLLFRSRRCSQSQSHKSFKKHNNTTAGLQMINKNKAQQKLLLLQVRWILFWRCRCCKRFKTSTASCFVVLFLGESIWNCALVWAQHFVWRVWLVTTASQNQSTLVKQVKGFWEICLQVLCYCSSKDSTSTHLLT